MKPLSFWDRTYTYQFYCKDCKEYHFDLLYAEFQGVHPWQLGIENLSTNVESLEPWNPVWKPSSTRTGKYITLDDALKLPNRVKQLRADLRYTSEYGVILYAVSEDEVEYSSTQKSWEKNSQKWLDLSKNASTSGPNREFVIDPALWNLIGDVQDLNVLDAGCGRGFLLRWLIASGYVADGTEIAEWLMAPGGDLCGMPVRELYYHQLGSLPDECYDVVVSSDVIEHLQTEDEVEAAMGQLVRISGGAVLVSTGGLRQAHNPFPQAVKFPVSGLHFVIRPKEWWLELYEQYCVVDKEFEAAGSYFIFGRKK